VKKLLFALATASMFLATALVADVPLNKKHKGQVGRDGAKVNCAYCHEKAGTPKEGKDYVKHRTGPYCLIEGCHK
jgi:cytochrome c553